MTVKFNKFEYATEELLHEAIAPDFRNAVQSAMKRMTPGSKLFEGPGNVSNKYDAKKNYYPNIRSGFMGLVNLSFDTAAQKVTERVNTLKAIDTWDPNVNLPAELKNIVSTQYSKDFMEKASNRINEVKTQLDASRKQIPRDNNLEIVFNDLLSADTSKMTRAELDKHQEKTRAAFEKFEDLLMGKRGPKTTSPQQFSMLQKATYNMHRREMEQEAMRWYKITRSMTSLNPAVAGSNNSQVGSAREQIGDTFLRKDVTIYRDRWEDFLSIVENATVGAGQKGFAAGSNVSSIIRGEAPGTWKKKGEVKYAEQQTLEPKMLKIFHEKIMMPLFMSGDNNVLIYATPEQWEQISEGGKLYRAGTWTGKQAWTAGQNAPKVSL